jgi:hypothetical protein
MSSFRPHYQMIGTLRDLDVDGLVNAMPTFTNAGRESLTKRLSEPIHDLLELQNRQKQIKAIKARATKVTELRKQLQATEDDVRSVADASSDKRHAEYYSQILWSPTSRFAGLNKLGWLNEAIVFFRTLFLPGLSILLPFFILVAPLVFYNLVLKEPLTFQGYFKLLDTSLKKAMPSVLGKPRFAGKGGVLEFGEQFIHIGVSIAMFVASIWNQLSAASTMRSVVDDMRKRADSVKVFARATADLAAAIGVTESVDTNGWPESQLGIFGEAWNTPARLHALLARAGELDMLVAIATTKRACFPRLGSTQLAVTDLFHPGLQPKARIYNSLTMNPDVSGNSPHVLLTGPNRGGKSTLLKSLGCAVLMAHTVGIVFARKAELPVFDSIITALSPQDTLGKLSLFEAEIEFAKDVKVRLAEPDAGNTFLMMDEIFHGTNAHDGVEASQVFLDDIYKTKRGLFSVVSTHYMDLPARYGSLPEGRNQSQNLCMDASVDPADPDRLVYTYQLKAGVNRFSSVREILRERGLCGSPVKKTTGPASKV